MAAIECMSDDEEDTTLRSQCIKLTLPENIAAYIEKRELNREIKPLECDKDLIEKVAGNYVIIKNILRHLIWQEKLVCKHVCSLWHSAIRNLQNEDHLRPLDFSVNLSIQGMKKGVVLKKSMEFISEPMAVFTFCNTVTLNVYTVACEAIVPSPCSPSCGREHSILDLIYTKTTAPKTCMYAAMASSVSYLPLAKSVTYENMIKRPLRGDSNLFFGGIYIPKVPGVEFRIINRQSSINIQEELNPKIKELTENYIVKGMVACLTDNYVLYANQQNAECLEFLREIQPDIPFAFGGCLIEDTSNTIDDISNIVESVNIGREFITGNLLSLGVFLIPKNEELKYNFEVYSLVIESFEWNSNQIKQAIEEFSGQVPRFEHSVALKLSCTGRETKHDIEQNHFRTFFPTTRVVGCFGNAELGVNLPRRKPRPTHGNKRAREDVAYEMIHSYSTVYFYICWGKKVAESHSHS